MKKISMCLLALAIVAMSVALPARAQDWAGSGRVKGVVESEAGDRLEGAEVLLKWGEEVEKGPEPIYTDKKGRWSYIGLKPGRWWFEIRAEGYRPFREAVDVFQNTVGEPLRSELREVSEEVKDAERRTKVNEKLKKGNELSQAGQYAEARAVFEEALEEMNEDEKPLVLTGVANTYIQDGDNAAGMAELEKALAINPEHPQALKLMIAVLAAEGLDEEAEQYIAKLPEGVALDPNAEMNLGILAYNDGDMDGAAEIFERVAAAYPDLVEAQYFSGIVHVNQGRNAEALAEFKHMLELDPEHEKAEEVKGFIDYLESSQ